MNDNQAMPTIYKGVRMKSRLEADVAFLLDRLGWKWDHEPEDFLLENEHLYLPSFRVARWNLWIGAGSYDTDKGKAQLEGFAQHLTKLPNDYPFQTFWVIKNASETLACEALPLTEELPTLAPGGFFAYCFHCKEWVFHANPDEEGSLRCPECLPAQGQIARWFRLEGRNGAVYVCTDQRSWLLQEWVVGYTEQQDPWEETRRTISCAYCSVMFDIQEPGSTIITLDPGAPLPDTWVTVRHQGISDYYCGPVCAVTSLLSTVFSTELKQDPSSQVAQHLDAYEEVEKVLYYLGPAARQNQ